MLKKILLVLLVLIVGFVGFVATRPGEFKVERSSLMSAPPEFVYAQVADFHKWGNWSPWEKLDPGMKRTLEGESGVGATYAWAGNDKAGEGKMTITDALPPERVVLKLEFIKPWTSTCTTTFGFAPEGAGTRTTWTMVGKNDFMGKAMGVFMNMDSMVGQDFERGLAGLNAASTAAVAAAPADSTAATSTP